MTLQKLNIQPKVANAAKKQMVTSNVIGTNETLQANEVNAIVNKVNEVVDAYNFGTPITAFNFKTNVPTYADLPLVGNEVNDGYGVMADGLVYVWNGTAFPLDGNGVDLGLRPAENSKVELGNPMAVSGNEVFENVKALSEPIYNTVVSHNLANPKMFFLDFAISPVGIYTNPGYTILIVPVDFTKKYTVSGWESFRDYIAFYSGNVPETATNLPSNLIQAGRINDVLGINKNGGKVSFQPLNGATWMAVLVKDPLEAISIYEMLQVEEGETATDYQPYGEWYELKPELKPIELSKKISPNSIDKAETGQSVSEFVESVLKPFADVVYSKNLANPKSFFLDFAISPAGIYSAIGYKILIVPVDFTKKYTVSGWESFRDYIAFYSGNVPETATNLPSNLIQAGRINAVLGINKNGDKATFQPLEGATWMAFLVKDISESNIVFSKFQIEEGEFATTFIEYNGATSIFHFTPEVNNKIKLRKVGDNIFIRTYFNANKDLVRTMALHGNANGAANLTTAKLILKNENIDATGERFHVMNDSIPPAFQVDVATNEAHFNVAGNHGLKSITDITTSSPHGKTSADLGSIWVDATGWEFYLIKIVSPTVLRIACKPQIIEGKDKVKINPVSPLNYVSGGFNTEEIQFSGNSYEYKPSIRNVNVNLYIDNQLITENGDYSGEEVKVTEFYEVADPTKPNLTPPYLPQENGLMLKYNLTHIFNYNNTSTHEGVADWYSNHYTKSHLVIVPQTMSKVSYTDVMTYTNNVGIKGIHNFDLGVNFNSNIPAYVTIIKDDLKNQSFHYNQFTHLIFNGELPIIGGGYGLLPIGQGKSEVQILNDSILEFSVARKGHPRPFTGFTENKVIRSIGYFSYWDASLNPKFSAAYSVKYGDVDFYMIQVRENIEKETLKMIGSLLNRELEILHKTIGLIIHTPDATTNEGLIVSGNVGDWAILKIL